MSGASKEKDPFIASLGKIYAGYTGGFAAFVVIIAMTTRRYEAPELQYLAWVLTGAANPSGVRRLKCLLCNKLVLDERLHSDSFQATRDHKTNVRNYMMPGNPWYEQNVAQ